QGEVRRGRRPHRPRRGDRLPRGRPDRAPMTMPDMTANSPPQPSLWRLVPLAVIFAYVLTDALLASQQMEGASDDFWPQWTLAHLAATGHGADSYDFRTQAQLFRDLRLPPHRMHI